MVELVLGGWRHATGGHGGGGSGVVGCVEAGMGWPEAVRSGEGVHEDDDGGFPWKWLEEGGRGGRETWWRLGECWMGGRES